MTFNAASRLRSLEDRSAALGSSRCELPGMHSVPKSAVLPYASGVDGLSRRLLNKHKGFHILVLGPSIWGIPEIMFGRILMFMWSFGALPQHCSGRSHMDPRLPKR